MLSYREIVHQEPAARQAGQMIQEYSWGLDYPVDAWEELRQSDFIYGCFDGDDLVGVASVSHVASLDKIDIGLPWFADVVVLPKYRQQGIFTELYKLIIARLKEENESIVVTCTKNPIVEQFLIHNGWVLRRNAKDAIGEDYRVYECNPSL